MLKHYNPIDIRQAIDQRLFPTITMWNRLEGRPRTHQFDKALKAEVRDALWMLCKQWQMGEFKGEDAGSVVFSKIKMKTSKLTNFTLANAAERPITYEIPLETLIEQKEIPMYRGKNKISLDLRLQLGKYWQNLLKKEGLHAYFALFLEKFNFSVPSRDRDNDEIHAHQEELKHWMAISGRCIDGYELLLEIEKSGNASSLVSLNNPMDQSALDQLVEPFLKYFQTTYVQPKQQVDQAWLPDRLEYKASLKADTSINADLFHAQEYYQGNLDWFAFNHSTNRSRSDIAKDVIYDTFIPTHVEFEGMPEKRWWKFEDAKTSFGNIAPNTTELSKLMLIQFGLSFANDWFLVPLKLPIGSIAMLDGLTVYNNFGDAYWIEATEQEQQPETKNWSVFKNTSSSNNTKLFLCPSAIKVQESEQLEDIWMIRDEQSNMVWGIEKIIPSAKGLPIQAGEYALQKRKYHESFINPSNLAIPFAAEVYYQSMNSVPENWIPFIPVHVNNHKRQIQLQRASMPRILEGDPIGPVKVKPMSSLLREGLDLLPNPKSYYLHEEEISRAGTRIVQQYQRTRWLDGQVYVWLASKKKVGRGEGQSGLAFDQILPSKKGQV